MIWKFVYEYKITKSIMSLYLSSAVTVKKVEKKFKVNFEFQGSLGLITQRRSFAVGLSKY